MTRIAIAGGTGMLGRAVSTVLEEKGHSLVLLSRRAQIAPGYEQVVQWWSWIHIADVCRFVVGAIEDLECTGTYNLTAPEPVRQREFAQTLGRVLGRPAVLPAPAFGLRLLLGGFSTELLDSKRVIPERLQNSGWRFAHPDLYTALKGLILRRRSDGPPASV